MAINTSPWIKNVEVVFGDSDNSPPHTGNLVGGMEWQIPCLLLEVHVVVHVRCVVLIIVSPCS